MARKYLNGWQFPNTDPEAISETIKKEGGVSINPTTGAKPTEGTMVSLPGHEKVVPEQSFGPEDVARYANSPENLSALTQKERHIGGWVSGASGNKEVFLDVSQRYPENPIGNAMARGASVRGSQYGIFNLTRGVTESNPAKQDINLPDKTKLAEGEEERYKTSTAPIGEHIAIGEVTESVGRGKKKAAPGQYRLLFLNDGDGPY
jgi:hypothetical protein